LEYRLLNIFYNRENEITFLKKFLSEELNVINNEKKHQKEIKKAKEEFNQYRYKLKLERRRKKIFRLIVLKMQNITSIDQCKI